MSASQISPQLQRRLSKYQTQRAAQALLTGTTLHRDDHAGELIITNPAAPRRGHITVEHATGYAFHHHDGHADPLGHLHGCHDPDSPTPPVTIQRITTLLAAGPSPGTDPPPTP